MTSWHCAAGGCRWTASILLLAFGPVAALCGCGGKVGSLNEPVVPASITGNWQLTATTSSGSAIPLGAYLTSNSGTVTGVLHSDQVYVAQWCVPGCCGGPFAGFNSAMSGSVNSGGKVTLGTPSSAAAVFSMSATAGDGLLADGSFTLTGAAACATQGSLTGQEYPSLNGTYTGTLTSQTTGQSFTLSATLSQSAAVTSYDVFSVSGSAVLTGNACMNSATVLTSGESNSSFLGNRVSATMVSTTGAYLTLTAIMSQDGKTLATTYSVSGGGCTDDYGQGTLTMQ